MWLYLTRTEAEVMDDPSRRRFALVTAGHHFLLQVLPFRPAQSESALQRFVDIVKESGMRPAERDAVLVRCLNALDRGTGGRLPTLLERYLAQSDLADNVERFADCVRHALKYHTITNRKIRSAISYVEANFRRPNLSHREVAAAVDLTAATLSSEFHKWTGTTVRCFVRNVRLEHAAVMLVNGLDSIKEIWAAVGYNHASNFDHDFKRHFGLTPGAFRASGHRVVGTTLGGKADKVSAEAVEQTPQNIRELTILLVEDDDTTRVTIAESLRVFGYNVTAAPDAMSARLKMTQSMPSALIIDYNLPDENGVEFLRSVRYSLRSRIPATIFTADWNVYDDESDVASLGAFVTSKLCNLAELEQVVMRLLSQCVGDSSSVMHLGS